MKRIRVTVTADDIERGQRDRADGCALALAVRRRVRGDALVWHGVWITGNRAMATLPGSAQQFVRDFDAGRPVKPATFLLPLPEDAA